MNSTQLTNPRTYIGNFRMRGVILYRMGEGYVRKLLGAILKLGMNTEEIIKGFERLAFLAGWGKLSLRIIDDKNAHYVVERCAFVPKRQDIGMTSCYLLAGILATAATTVFNKKFKAQ